MTTRATDPTLIVDVHTNADTLPPDAQELFATAERRNVECGLTWYRILGEQVVGTGLRFLVLRRQGICVAAIALNVGPDPGALSNYYTAFYEPALAPGVQASDLVPLVHALRVQCRGAGRYNFAPMDPHAPSFQLLERALALAGLVTYRYFRFGNWYLPCHAIGWAGYLAGRDGAVRSTIRRMGKRFAADGGTLEVVTAGDRVELGIDAYEQVYSASWKQAEPYPGFVRELIRNAASKGWLRLGVARLGERAIAAQIWIVAHGRAEIFKLAYDDEFKAYSAGTLLTVRLMQGAIDEDKVHEVDYLIGDDAYKKAWMSHRRERWGVVAFDPRTLTGLAGLARESVGRMVRRRAPTGNVGRAEPGS